MKNVTLSRLSLVERKLVRRAIAIRNRAHAPFSNSQCRTDSVFGCRGGGLFDTFVSVT